MPSPYEGMWGMTVGERWRMRKTSSLEVMTVGDNRLPDPPRSIVAQSGSRKAVITWSLPVRSEDICGFHIYKYKESNRIKTISNPLETQTEVSLDAGATPPKTAIYISCYNTFGKESSKVQVICSAVAEAGAPTDPSAPTGYVPPDYGLGDDPLSRVRSRFNT